MASTARRCLQGDVTVGGGVFLWRKALQLKRMNRTSQLIRETLIDLPLSIHSIFALKDLCDEHDPKVAVGRWPSVTL